MESPDHARTLLKAVHQLYKQCWLTDVTLVAEDKMFSAHRILLAAFSPHLKTELAKGCSILYIQEHLPDITAESLKLLLDFMYSGKLLIDQHNARSLLTSAKQLQVPSAIKLCEQFLAKSLQVNPGSETAQLGQPKMLDEIKEEVLTDPADEDDSDTELWLPSSGDRVRHSLRRRSQKYLYSARKTSAKKQNDQLPVPNKAKPSLKRKKNATSRQRRKMKRSVSKSARTKRVGLLKAKSKCTCLNCRKQFPFYSALKFHQRIHGSLPPFCSSKRLLKVSLLRKTMSYGRFYRCRLCSQPFKHSYVRYKKHVLEKHWKKDWSCSQCSESFTNGYSLGYHCFTKHNKLQRCRHCARVFLHKGNLLKHFNSCTPLHSTLGAGAGCYCCFHCDRNYKTVKNLKVHLNGYGLDTGSWEEVVALFDPGAKPTSKKKPKRAYPCEICGKTYQKRKYVKVHKIQKHSVEDKSLQEIQCTEPNCHFKTFFEHQLKVHQKTHTDAKLFECQTCGKFLKTAVILQVHMRTHHQPRSFICDQCGMTYGRESQLNEHIERHNNVKPYSCPACKYATHSEKSLKNHMFSIHKIQTDAKQKIYQCEKCGYTTPSHNYLKVHMKAHSNVKDIPCPNCGKMYVTKMALKQHLRCSHGPKTLKCHICGYVTNQRTKLKDHVRVTHTHPDHKPYKCCYCDFVSATSGNCRKHVMHRHKDKEVQYVRMGPKCPPGFVMPKSSQLINS